MGLNFFKKQTHHANGVCSIIERTFHGYWMLDNRDHQIIDNAVFITYRVRDEDYHQNPMTANFYRWSRQMLRAIIDETGNRKWVQQRQGVGMYAMDYDDSRNGRYVATRHGAHVHSILVFHPEIIGLATSQLDAASERYGMGFYWQPVTPEKTLAEMIHYNLKGIMNEGGFYPGRSGLWDWIGPRRGEPFIA